MTTSSRAIKDENLKAFIKNILCAEGVVDSVAEYVASGLVQASLRGVDSHGAVLFPHYFRALKAGRINPKPKYKFSKTSHSTGILDADHTYGHAAGMEAVKKAVALAKTAGSGHVSVKNSSHFGAAAFYALEIANHDMIGMSFTHADSLMLTYDGTKSFFGTNPLCFAAPCEGEGPFCLDMATTMVNFNKIIQLRKRRSPAPPDAGADTLGNRTTDPEKIVSLFPIGRYKGFGLAAMVEILSSLLTGMPYGRDITNMYRDPISKKRHLGHFFSAIRIDCFEDVNRFKRRMRQLLEDIRKQPRRHKDIAVQAAGDPEKAFLRDRSVNGIPVSLPDWQAFRDIGKRYGLDLKEVKHEKTK